MENRGVMVWLGGRVRTVTHGYEVRKIGSPAGNEQMHRKNDHKHEPTAPSHGEDTDITSAVGTALYENVRPG
jgi:hypothetical protein